MKTERQNNFEFLRILLMVMIIMHHLLVHSLQMKNLIANQFPATSWVHFATRAFVNSFLVVSVNVFVLISGYFGVKFKAKNIVVLVASGAMMSCISNLIVYFVNKDAVAAFSPWGYWFLVAYFVLLFLGQYIDKLISVLTNRQLLSFAGILFFLFCVYGFYYNFAWLGLCGGASAIHVLGVYCAGRIIRRFEAEIRSISRWKYLFVYLGSCLSVFVLVVLGSYASHYRLAWSFYSYVNPLVVLASISLFALFLKTHIGLNVRWISGSVFGVYLLHDNVYVRSELLSVVSKLPLLRVDFMEIVVIPLIAIGVFVVCFPVSYLVDYSLRRVVSINMATKWFAKIDELLKID